MDCGECGREDCEPDFVECCEVWMCDFCRERHDGKYGHEEATND